jgi:hypothetical protein
VCQLQIDPDRRLSARALHKRAVKLAKAYDRDWYLVVRKLQDPAVRSIGQEYSMFAEASAALPPPVSVVRVYADGREEILRGARFAGVDRYLLRDIVGAGAQNRATWLASASSFGSGATTGLSTLTWAPDILVGEVEVVPAPGDPRDAPVVPAP